MFDRSPVELITHDILKQSILIQIYCPVGEKYCVQFIAKFFWTFVTSLLGQALTIGQGQGNVKRIEINQVTFQDISVILSDPSKALSHLLSVSVQVRVMTQDLQPGIMDCCPTLTDSHGVF